MGFTPESTEERENWVPRTYNSYLLEYCPECHRKGRAIVIPCCGEYAFGGLMCISCGKYQ
jgi:hypothetical protein